VTKGDTLYLARALLVIAWLTANLWKWWIG
jgi:hypothetical protein